MMDDSCKLVLKLQTPLGGFQSILFPASHLTIFSILQSYHANDRFNFNCHPKPSDFIRQRCYDNYISTVTKPHGLIPRNVVTITLGVLCACWIGFAIYGAVTLRRRPGYKEKNTKKFLRAYFIHVFFRIFFLGAMLGLVCSYQTIFLPSVFKCGVNEILQTNIQTTPSPLNQTKLKLQCNDLHYKEKSYLNIAFISVDAFFMVVSILEVLHLYRIRENYMQKFVGNLEDFEVQELLQKKPTITNTEVEVDKDFIVTWSEAEASSSNRSIKYRLECWKQFMTRSTKSFQQGDIVETRHTITGLEYDTEYEVKLFAVNEQGESEPDVRTFKTKSGLPEKPTVTNTETVVDKDFTVMWSEAEANSSTRSIKYRLEWRKQPVTGFTEMVQRGNIEGTHLKITGLEYDAEYEVKLFAVNEQGDSEPDVRTFKTKSGGYDPTEMINNIRQLYKTREGRLAPFPWCEDFNFSFDDIYTRLQVIYRKNTRGTATDRVVTMSEIFNRHEECEEPRVVLIEGKPAMGKTTYCEKVVFDWATGKHATGNCFTNFVIVLLIKCRGVESGLWEAIEDQLLPREVGEDERERFFDFIRHNQSNVLLVLDGLDEVSEKKLPMFSEIIQGRVLPNCRVVATARHEAGVKVQKYCDTLLKVEGFTEEDVETFVRNYFRAEQELAEQLIDLYYDYDLHEILTNPLNTALLCLVFEDLKGALPESRTELYMEIVECVLRRYRTKQQLPENGEDLVDLYESQLKHLGSIALKGLLEDNLDFDEKELGKHKGSDLPGFGFLSVQPGGSKLRPTRRYSFLHKTFQEFFAAFYLSCQLINEEISANSIAADRKYRHELKEVLLFAFGMLAARCEETVMNLLKSIATQLNQEEEEDVDVILECVSECKKKKKNVDEKLATALGASLQYETVFISEVKRDETLAVILSNFLKTNTTVKNLELNGFSREGAAALVEHFKYDKSLEVLNLSWSVIGEDGAAALGEYLKCNTSLKTLSLCSNNIGDDGTAALGECLKYNTSLTTLKLKDNAIGDDGTAALGECLKYNTSLTTLKLNKNKIGDGGGAALGECLKNNSSLTTLNLNQNKIGDDGAAALGECLKYNTSLTTLSLILNKIGDDGAAALGECLKYNTSLTGLRLSANVIGNRGAAALGECLKYNSSLTMLCLNENEIGDDGAGSLGECLKCNTSLAILNEIDDNGAAALGESLKYNTSLTILSLNDNEIGDDGAAALGECLKYNTSLTELNLSGHKISDAGAAALLECLKYNTSLTELNLSGHKVGDAGAAALGECLKYNKSLTKLDLNYNKIGDVGAAALGECLKYNKSLTWLKLSGNEIGDDGTAALVVAQKCHPHLTISIESIET